MARRRKSTPQPRPPAKPSSATHPAAATAVRWRFNWRPQVLVFMATLFIFWFPLARGIAAVVWAGWSDSYQVRTWTMESADPNQGYAYIDGRLDHPPRPMRLSARIVDGVIAIDGRKDLAFEAGRQLPVWYSETAPDLMVQEWGTNVAPVAVMPRRPGWLDALFWLGLAFGLLWAGMRLATWVALRWGYSAGDATMDSRIDD